MKRAAASRSLPDDVVLEILVRVKDDAVALFRCATSGKLWRRLVADPSFLRRCWPEDACPSLVGFFVRDNGFARPYLVPHPRSAMGRDRRALSTFVPAASELLIYAEPLVSRHGLLLVRLAPHGAGAHPGTKAIHLAVCNLLLGEYHVLPPLNCSQIDPDPTHYCWSGFAVLSGADCHSDSKKCNSSFFKVVIIDSEYNLHTFSFDEASWSKPTKCFGDASTANYIPICRGHAVVSHDTAHWLFYDLFMSCLCTVDMYIKDGHVSLTRTPFQMDCTRCCNPCLTLDIDGTLSLIYTQWEVPGLVIWKTVNGISEWFCIWRIMVTDPDTPRMVTLYMLEEKRDTMIVYHHAGFMRVLDLETGTVEELGDWPSFHTNLWEVVPLQMDWSAFFLCRLGNQQLGGDAHGRH